VKIFSPKKGSSFTGIHYIPFIFNIKFNKRENLKFINNQ
jgi:hypothetical protein